MKTLNQTTLRGYLGENPKIKEYDSFRSGYLQVATHESYLDKEGKWQQMTEWHTVKVSSNKFLDGVFKTLVKGDLVHVEGRHRTREWKDDDGKLVKFPEVVVGVRGFIGKVEKLMGEEGESNE